MRARWFPLVAPIVGFGVPANAQTCKSAIAEIARRLFIPLELIRMDFPPMVPALTAGRFDGINTGMFWTEERDAAALKRNNPPGEQRVVG